MSEQMIDDSGRSFVESMEKLQKAATEIARQGTSLEDSLKLFESGMEAANYCRKKLNEAEQKISEYKEEE